MFIVPSSAHARELNLGQLTDISIIEGGLHINCTAHREGVSSLEGLQGLTQLGADYLSPLRVLTPVSLSINECVLSK